MAPDREQHAGIAARLRQVTAPQDIGAFWPA
jgi:hypothetical protein